MSSHNFEADSSLKSANDQEVTLWIFYDYQPFEPQELNYPGCDAEVDVYEIRINGEPCTEWHKVFSTKELKEIDSLCWDDCKNRMTPDA